MPTNALTRTLLMLVQLISMAVINVAQEACPVEPFYLLEVRENSGIDSVVMTLQLRGTPDDVTLTASQNDYFRFVPENLTVVVAREIDYDVGSNGLPAQKLEIQCTERDGQETSLEINIQIIDINDNSPEFEEDVYTVRIGEMTESGTEILTYIQASDKDARARIYYDLEQGPYTDYFILRDRFSTVLKLQKELDYETLRGFNITLIAMDGQAGSPGVFTTTCDVIIKVTDQDDQNPVFNSSIYRAVITSEAVKDSLIDIDPPIYADDPDVTIGERVVYSFHASLRTCVTKTQCNSSYVGQGGDILDIDAVSGQVKLITRPRANQVYLLVQATQVDTPSRYGVALLAVEVQGSNVNAPVFSRPSYAVTVTEVFPRGEAVAMVMATDADPGAKVDYSLMDQSSTFVINRNTGDVILNKPLSFISQSQYDLTVRASDGTWNTSTPLTVSVRAVNNKPPTILSSDVARNVTLMSAEKGDTIMNIEAVDYDDTTAVLSYQLLTFTDLFAVSQTGRITIIAEPEDLVFETYHITVVVSDSSLPPYSTACVVTAHLPRPPRPLAAIMAADDALLPIVLGAVAAVFLIVIVILVVYIARRRNQDREDLSKVKQRPSHDPQALTYKQRQATLGKKGGTRVNIDFRDGETTVQENPLNIAKNTYFDFKHLDGEDNEAFDDTDIQVETSVAPYVDHLATSPYDHGDDNNNSDNNHSDNNHSDIYTIDHNSDSDEYRAMEKTTIASIYSNGSLSTFRDSESGSELSLHSPTDSADSKRGLMPGNLARTRVAEERRAPSSMSDMEPIDVDQSLEPLPQKQELTVYF